MFCCLRIPPFLPRTHGSEAPVSVLPPVRSLSMVESGCLTSLLCRSLLDSGLQAVCLFTCEVCQEPSHMGGHVDISYCRAGPWIFIAGTESLLTKELMSQGLGQPRGCWSKFLPCVRGSLLYRGRRALETPLPLLKGWAGLEFK